MKMHKLSFTKEITHKISATVHNFKNNNNNSEIEERRRKGIDHSTISKDIKVLRDITAICF